MPVQEAEGSLLGAPVSLPVQCVDPSGVEQLEGGVEERQRLERPQVFLPNAHWTECLEAAKEVNRKTELNLIKTNLLNDCFLPDSPAPPTPRVSATAQSSSGNGLGGFLDQRGQRHVALAHPRASKPAMEMSARKYF